MPVIGSKFTELSFIRNELKTKTIKLEERPETKIDISDVKEVNVSLAGADKALAITFNFQVSYKTEVPKNKELGSVKIVAEILYLTDDTGKIVKEWKKSKKLPQDIFKEVMDAAFGMSLIEATYFASKVQLPLPVPFMNIQLGEKPK